MKIYKEPGVKVRLVVQMFVFVHMYIAKHFIFLTYFRKVLCLFISNQIYNYCKRLLTKQTPKNARIVQKYVMIHFTQFVRNFAQFWQNSMINILQNLTLKKIVFYLILNVFSQTPHVKVKIREHSICPSKFAACQVAESFDFSPWDPR